METQAARKHGLVVIFKKALIVNLMGAEASAKLCGSIKAQCKTKSHSGFQYLLSISVSNLSSGQSILISDDKQAKGAEVEADVVSSVLAKRKRGRPRLNREAKNGM